MLVRGIAQTLGLSRVIMGMHNLARKAECACMFPEKGAYQVQGSEGLRCTA